jgi:hypothetical protein
MWISTGLVFQGFPGKEEVDRYWMIPFGFSEERDQFFGGRFGLSYNGYWIDRIGLDRFFLELGLVFLSDQLLTQNYAGPPACTMAELPVFPLMVITAEIVKHRVLSAKKNETGLRKLTCPSFGLIRIGLRKASPTLLKIKKTL